MNTNTIVSLFCLVSLLAVLGGGVLFVLYSTSEIGTMLRRWLDRK